MTGAKGSAALSEHFNRQRRNLMLSSVILFLFVYADAAFKSEISILGLQITAGNLDKLEWLPLLLLAYFLLRYWQALLQEERNDFRSIYIEYFEKIAQKKCEAAARRKLAESIEIGTEEGFRIREAKFMPWPIFKQGYVQVYNSGDDNPVYIKQPRGIRVVKFEFARMSPKEDGYPGSYEIVGGKFDKSYVETKLSSFIREHLSALWRSVFNTSHATEFWLPLVFATVVLVYALCSSL